MRAVAAAATGVTAVALAPSPTTSLSHRLPLPPNVSWNGAGGRYIWSLECWHLGSFGMSRPIWILRIPCPHYHRPGPPHLTSCHEVRFAE